jgi:carboxyl-terminal processing protease
VGEKTFGKGTVQQPENFADGSGLHVTVAKWLLPSGRNIHGTGVEPDMEVKYEAPKEATGSAGSDNQLGAAIDVLLL